MEKLVEWFARPGVAVLVVTFVWLTFLTRKAVETAWPSLVPMKTECIGQLVVYKSTASRWWNSFFLDSLPVLWACLVSLVNSEFLFGNIQTYHTRFLVAAAIGWLSSVIYKIAKLVIPRTLGVKVAGDTGKEEVVEEEKKP